ncbi:phosphotransferase family protein [Paenibacillus humicola]|uniref:phosphotransferase family protein n=1 Tax=Paenibacillus humicola TaxID=3110540 RepID=UPI00237ACE82|nr:aminoglycoside phosphotransferase family protein [Paenibacillus humicola]
MKEGWERILPPVHYDVLQISEIVRPAFPHRKIAAAERIGIGLSNVNYKITLDGSDVPYVVRLYRMGTETAEKELAIARLIRETVPVADFLYADTSCSSFPKPWAVLEWKEGVLLRDVMQNSSPEDIASAAASAGSVLADIHRHPFAESGFFDRHFHVTERIEMSGERFLSFIENSLSHEPCGEWLGGELSREVRSFAQKYAPLLSESGETPVLVHSDYNGLNILVRQGSAGWEVSAVLDWEDSFAFSRNADIANLLRYEEDGSRFEKHAVAAYLAQGGKLEGNWKLLSKLEDLVALCDMLSSSTSNTPNRVRDLQRLIARTVRSY